MADEYLIMDDTDNLSQEEAQKLYDSLTEEQKTALDETMKKYNSK